MKAAVERILHDAGAPGCSVAVVDASGEVMTAAFGFADVRRELPARPDTIYPLFSGTKLFTATAVLQLAERGLLDLNDPLEKFVPTAGAARGVTLEQLLSHRSGLKDTLRAFLAVTIPPEPQPDSAQALARYRLVAGRAAGTKVEYRNVNYALLGEVVSRVSGVEYREYVRNNVLEPLGMDATST
jgi:putative ATP-binding cassette transporter